jgi:hypothetical protein
VVKKGIQGCRKESRRGKRPKRRLADREASKAAGGGRVLGGGRSLERVKEGGAREWGTDGCQHRRESGQPEQALVVFF